jgi:hypothetical protein
MHPSHHVINPDSLVKIKLNISKYRKPCKYATVSTAKIAAFARQEGTQWFVSQTFQLTNSKTMHD